ncbi:MAG: LysR family transcriptional regulator [Beijerinckiaceae bacterium]|nr:LysR family transcriptional regulator [Beijerinckiaceae bacterium]
MKPDLSLADASIWDGVGDSAQQSTPGAALSNLRRLRVFVAVTRSGSMQSAAAELNTSRSSVTKIIKKLEAQLGASLFIRTSKRLVLSAYGEMFTAAAEKALAHLEAAEAEIGELSAGARPKRRFIHNITNSQVMALLAVISQRSHTAAAAQLQVTQPAITMALRDLQNAVGFPLLQKCAGGIVPNSRGLILAEGVRRAFAELEDLGNPRKPGRSPARERVTIGVLPLAGALVPARAIESFLNCYPDANLTLVEGPYASLLRGLRSGEIDVIIGGLSSPGTEPDISHQQLYNEEIMAAVRSSHPLASERVASLDQLLRFKWVVPRTNTPARTTLEQLLEERNVPMPRCIVETNSILATRSLLMEGDRVAFITHSQVEVDERSGVLCTVGLNHPRSRVPVGVRLRVDCRPSATLTSFLGHLTKSGSEYRSAHH